MTTIVRSLCVIAFERNSRIEELSQICSRKSLLNERRLIFLAVLFSAGIAAAAGNLPANRRAKPPQFSEKEKAVFFTDAREKLIGERPRPGSSQSPATPASDSTPSESPANASGGSFSWSKIIAPDVIEDEIKSLQREMSKSLTALGPFKGGGYKQARVQLSVLAVMFGVISEYDGDVRWKQQASPFRDLLARAGFNAKVGTDASFNEAKLRKDDLELLVQGNPLQLNKTNEPPEWSKITGRPPLMARMKQAHEEGVAVWTSSSTEFSKNSDRLLHEAQVLATLAEVIQREGFEDADSEDYRKFAQAVRDGSLQIVDAVKQKKYDQARAASGEISKSCTSCHENYRS
jgi:hypothetical protein